VWEKETPQEKRDRKADLEERNSLIEKANKQRWQKQQRKWLREWIKAHGRRPSGVKKKWVHNKKTSAFIVKTGRGGINWYRYQKKILIPKLLPFARECLKDRLETLV
jgi:hypothetical protein